MASKDILLIRWAAKFMYVGLMPALYIGAFEPYKFLIRQV